MTLLLGPQCPPTQSLNIGLTAYAALPGLVFVRVPNEKGRWLLTDRCVVEVDCPYCGSVAGEPCKRKANQWNTTPLRYHTGVHTYRREAARKLHGWAYRNAGDKPKLRISAGELAASQEQIGDESK